MQRTVHQRGLVDRTVRDDWLTRIVRECQTFAGEVVLQFDSAQFEKTAQDFVASLPQTGSRVEELVRRGLLIEVALHWFVHAGRRRAKRRDDIPFEILCKPSRRGAGLAFVEWARALARAQSLSIAERAARMIRAQFSSKLYAARLAKAVGESPGDVRQAFQREFGLTLLEYQHVARILYALQQIQTTRGKIEPIALEAGYRSKNNFYRRFQKEIGLTPTEFRELSMERMEHIIDRVKDALAGRTAPGRGRPRSDQRVVPATGPAAATRRESDRLTSLGARGTAADVGRVANRRGQRRPKPSRARCRRTRR